MTSTALNAGCATPARRRSCAPPSSGYGDKLALVSSFGAESAVLLHMAAQIDPDIPVLFLDTGMLFGQTLDYRQQLAARLRPDRRARPAPQYQDLAIHDPGADLWKTDTDACCNIRKVLPLDRALSGFDGWLTGRKRFQGGERLRLQVVEAGERPDQVQSAGQLVQARARRLRREHDLPPHPLVEFGYPVDRLLALHQAGGGGPGRPRRSLGWIRTRPNAAFTWPAPRQRWKWAADI